MFDLKTVLISLFSSTTTVAVLIYIFKKGFDKSIDYKFTQADNRNKIQLEELKRRQSILFDKIFEAEKSLLSEIYESRNLIKYEVVKLIEERNFNQANEIIAKLAIKEKIISDILIKERIILNEDIFKLSHDFKHALLNLQNIIKRYNNKEIFENHTMIDHKKTIDKIDFIYESITISIKKHYENSISK